MATIKTTYMGQLCTHNTHMASGQTLATDAPVENNGQGQTFSPTDLLACAYADCIITNMGIKAKEMNIDLAGTSITTTKVMDDEPRRISELKVNMLFPPMGLTEDEKMVLEIVARKCPVEHSLHPDIKLTINFNW